MHTRTRILTFLVVLCLLAIGVSIFVKYQIPAREETRLEKLDEQRIADIDSLDAALKVALPRQAAQALLRQELLHQELVALSSPVASLAVATSKVKLKNASTTTATSTIQMNTSSSTSASSTQPVEPGNTVYISIPSESPTCDDLDLPSLPDRWQYHCVPVNNLAKTDGTGWLPVNFDMLSPGTMITLPVDPVNRANTDNYYAFVKDGGEGIGFALYARVDSRKRHFNLMADAQAQGDILYDRAGTKDALADSALGVMFKFIGDLSNNPMTISQENYPALDTIGSTTKNYSIIVCFRSSASQDQSLIEKWDGLGPYPFALRGPLPTIRFATFDGTSNPTIDSLNSYDDNINHCAIAIRDGDSRELSLYIDGANQGTVEDTTGRISNSTAIEIGNRNIVQPKAFHGDITFAAIYSRALNGVEVTY
jgi:hypothetical protein